MKRRAIALVLDGILDLLTATGVPALIMLSFYKDYDFELGGFPAELCEHAGEMAQVAKEWNELDPMYTRRILVTHCPVLEVPPELQGFSNMIGMKMYNNTISRWEFDAAITGTHHPNLVAVVLGRVNTTPKTLPPGLLSPDFPRQLTDLSLSFSNLEAFPDEIYLMGSNMTYLPKWVDVYLAKPRTQWYVAPLDLSMTPFCDALTELRAGTRSQFPEEWTRGVPTDQISNYMFLRSENVTALDGLIECASQWIIYFPTEDEDRRNGL
ncbi:hypothetical protein P43SY_007313 [Pythium insidiosum]|uniref:Uncharacterized protein n=1 Tax=Pythium insidiosum TaxID=114742 RepID=A0AAD5M112_PYTIN|nr:hypothetical protein P43SY_007313 [Pythium insidiosum]